MGYTDLTYNNYLYILKNIHNKEIEDKINGMIEIREDIVSGIKKAFKDRIIGIYKAPLEQKYYVALWFGKNDICSNDIKKCINIYKDIDRIIDIETVEIQPGEKPWMYSDLIFVFGKKNLSKKTK